MAGYDPKLAAIANDYMRQGYDPETAATLAGIPEEDQSSYIVNDVPGDPNRGFITQTGADRPVDATATVPTTTNLATGAEQSAASGETVATTAASVPPADRVTSTTGINDGTYGSGASVASGAPTTAPAAVSPNSAASSGNPIGGLSYDPNTQQVVDPTVQNLQATGVRATNDTTVGNDAFSLVPSTSTSGQGIRATSATGLDPRFITTTTDTADAVGARQQQDINDSELSGYNTPVADVQSDARFTLDDTTVDPDQAIDYGSQYTGIDDLGIEGGLHATADEFGIPDNEALTYGDQFGLDDPEANLRLNTGPDDIDPFDTTGFEELPPPIELEVDPDPQSALFGSTKNTAQSQGVVRTDRRSTNNRDWRVRLSLAPGADYLYNAAAPGDLLFPLQTTNGIIFPYTPSIQTTYQTTYTKTGLTHSNYLGLFYQNSSIPSVSITATFTAQDTWEAEYLLAVIHFLRSAGKMFYGQDALAGAPPPLLYLSGFGEFQFNDHPCVLENFTYILPQDVDYIRANSVNQTGLNLLQRRKRQTNANPYDGITGALGRLQQLGQGIGRLTGLIKPGANPKTKTTSSRQFEIGGDNPTYVPTKMEITLVLVPVQTRSQISKQFSVDGFARGDLLRGGFW